MNNSSEITRGFITIATGKPHYYEIARNLLRSYRLFSPEPLPFAIVCDQQNAITSEFDDVIVIENPCYSFLDKLRLPDLVPYDETIFIDADCLAYRDLNGLWKAFEGAGDFSSVGYSYPFGTSDGWFQRDDAGPFKDKVKFTMILQGGLYFFRKGKLKTFSSACGYILDNYDMFRFPTYPSTNPIDEPIFALASSILGYPPAISYKHLFCYYPLCDSIKADISKGRLSYRYPYKMRDTLGRYFLHWSTVETRGEMYAEEVRKLEAMVESGFKPPRRWEYRNRLTDCVRVIETVVFRFMYYHIPKGLRERLSALFKYFR